MKKFLLFVGVFILICIAASSIFPIFFLGIGLAIAYYSIKSFMKSPTFLGKLWWGIAALCGISMMVHFIPALIGIAAIALLYYGHKQWKKEKPSTMMFSDPDYADFKNFEKEWQTIMSKY